MTVVPATLLTAAVTVLAVLFFLYTMINVGRMRGKHGVNAPAMTGPQEFECAVRVQANTVEQMIMFLPLLWLATAYFKTWAWLPALLGLVWVIGRVIYLNGYMSAPDRRSFGFLVGAVALLGLLILAVVGIVQTWMAVTAA